MQRSLSCGGDVTGRRDSSAHAQCRSYGGEGGAGRIVRRAWSHLHGRVYTQGAAVVVGAFHFVPYVVHLYRQQGASGDLAHSNLSGAAATVCNSNYTREKKTPKT